MRPWLAFPFFPSARTGCLSGYDVRLLARSGLPQTSSTDRKSFLVFAARSCDARRPFAIPNARQHIVQFHPSVQAICSDESGTAALVGSEAGSAGRVVELRIPRIGEGRIGDAGPGHRLL